MEDLDRDFPLQSGGRRFIASRSSGNASFPALASKAFTIQSGKLVRVARDFDSAGGFAASARSTAFTKFAPCFEPAFAASTAVETAIAAGMRSPRKRIWCAPMRSASRSAASFGSPVLQCGFSASSSRRLQRRTP
jgi:hypothetical protein